MTDPGESPAAAHEAQPAAGVVLRAEEAMTFGLRFHKAGFFEEAETLYRRILVHFPDHADALHFLGLLCHQQNRHTEAVELIGRIVALFPQRADAHNSLGNALSPLERPDESEACYRKAIELDPLHADAHNNLGVLLSIQNRPLEAIEAHRRAVELKPDSDDFLCNLGNALKRSDRNEEAISAYIETLVLDADNLRAWHELSRTLLLYNLRDEAPPTLSKLAGLSPKSPLASYFQAACVGENAPARAPDAFVEDMFDKMAESFDEHLIGNLDYRAPNLVIEALAAAEPAPALDILDAGCGTGLCGPLLRSYAKSLTGVDLSSKMLNKAEERKTYDRLVKSDLSAFLGSNFATYDVIVSADTLCYFGALETVFENAFQALKEGGLFVFTLEDAQDGTRGWRLNPNARYAHAMSYVEGVLGAAGFAVKVQSVVLRKECNKPVQGHLVTAWKKSVV